MQVRHCTNIDGSLMSDCGVRSRVEERSPSGVVPLD